MQIEDADEIPEEEGKNSCARFESMIEAQNTFMLECVRIDNFILTRSLRISFLEVTMRPMNAKGRFCIY